MKTVPLATFLSALLSLSATAEILSGGLPFATPPPPPPPVEPQVVVVKEVVQPAVPVVPVAVPAVPLLYL